MRDGWPGPVLITAEQIARRVAELGERITSEHSGQELVLVGVLKGSLFFLADLARQIRLPLVYELVTLQSYGDATQAQHAPELIYATRLDIKGRPVVIVEDIVDTGHTLDHLRRALLAESPLSLRVCTLLDKRGRRQVELPLDYVGFVIPEHFVVGYGLDLAQRYRHLPAIVVLDDESATR